MSNGALLWSNMAVLKKDAKIAILGAGNIGLCIARGVVAAEIVPANNVFLTRKSTEHLEKMGTEGFVITSDNSKAVEASQVLIVCVTPQTLNSLLDSIRDTIRDDHLLISVVSGATVSDLTKRIGNEKTEVVRAMPNTAIAFRESMTCLAGRTRKSPGLAAAKAIFDALGDTLVLDEEQIVPATALCACGIAFFCRAIRAASQGGIEIGFHSEDAIRLAAQTAKGAATMLLQPGAHPEREVDKVTTPMGCTIAGLNKMEHSGFSSAFIKGIVASAEKAAVLYKKPAPE